MNHRVFLMLLCAVFTGSTASAGIVARCLPTAEDAGCGILSAVTPDDSETATLFSVVGQPGSVVRLYNGSENPFVGILNTERATANGLASTNIADFFDFADGAPCTVNPNPDTCESLDPFGYAGPDVTFGGISSTLDEPLVRKLH